MKRGFVSWSHCQGHREERILQWLVVTEQHLEKTSDCAGGSNVLICAYYMLEWLLDWEKGRHDYVRAEAHDKESRCCYHPGSKSSLAAGRLFLICWRYQLARLKCKVPLDSGSTGCRAHHFLRSETLITNAIPHYLWNTAGLNTR